MTKPRVFVGSSVEGRAVAEAVQESLEFDAEVTIWSQGIFELMRSNMENLTDFLHRFDFAIFVFSADDTVTTRGETFGAIRDNVIFELGLFLGHLGTDRTFILAPRGADFRLPSDLVGATPATFDPNRGDGNLAAAVGTPCTQIKRKMAKMPALPRAAAPSRDQEGEREAEGRGDFPPSEILVPQAGWDRFDFDHAQFMAIYFDKEEEEKAIDSAFRAHALGSDPEQLALWEAQRELVRLQAGKGGSLPLMKSLLEKHPSLGGLHLLVGAALAHFNDHAAAADASRAAAVTAKSPADLSKAVRQALAEAEAAKADVVADAVGFAAAIRQTAKSAGGEDLADLLAAMQEVARSLGLKELSLAVLEKRVSLEPQDIGLRFDLAYKYSDGNRPRLAFAHYFSIPTAQRSGTAWNNLGVSYTNLQMPGRGIAAYTRASELRETIADANLADRLSGIGFFAEAQKRVEAAMQKPDYHSNLVVSLDAIRRKREEEGNTETETLDKARLELGFMASVGTAVLAQNLPDLRGDWNVGECLIKVTSEDGLTFVGVGEYQSPAMPGLGNSLMIRTAPRTTRVTVNFRRLGNALEGTMTSSGVNEPVSLLGQMMATRELLMLVHADGGQIAVWEKGSDEPRQPWSRVAPLLT